MTTPETHEIKLYFVGSMYIETVQDCTSHKNIITLNLHHFGIQFRRCVVYFIDLLESGYHTDTEVNFCVRIVAWVMPSNSSEIQKTPEMNELESDKQNLKRWAHNFEKQKNESNLIEVEKKKLFFPLRQTWGSLL